MKLAPLAAVAVLAAAPALAAGLVAVQRPETQTAGKLTVTSPALKSGAPMPRTYTWFGQNVSPPLSWSVSPAAKSYAILVEDSDAPAPTPLCHWVVWNFPANMTMAPEGSNAGVQGTNSKDTKGYDGPHTPPGPPHHYHFEVLALDRMLSTPAGADREAMLAAAKGHVVAKGELVATFRAPTGG